MSDSFDINQIQNIIDAGIPQCADIGVKVHEMDEGGVTFRLPYDEKLAGNPVTGVLHGGVITTLIDSASGMCIYVKLKKYIPIATLDLRIDYLKPATPGEMLYAHAYCYKLTEKIGFVRSVAYHTDRNDPIANSVSTFMLRSSATPPLNEVSESMKKV
ncbi:PaaI family thioesterase [Sneathiella chinensis]|uniref:PaaI-family thioesterase n=1 Tax=Sneathiella chinensis TaxID=349750 RepID=A0ABQ5U446_9PROT|nr:PaaI family thioesterase [Sneathiella chinensis]GLQ06508.1 PaaI-family thioesterase [Sneathiella chinensis]